MAANSHLLQEGDIDLLRRCFVAGRPRDADYRDDDGTLPSPDLVASAGSFLSDMEPGQPAALPAPIWQALALSCFVGAEMLMGGTAVDALLVQCNKAMRLIRAVPRSGT